MTDGRRGRWWLLAGCAASTLLIAACTPDHVVHPKPETATATRPPPSDPCRLLSVAQIKAATGWVVEKGVHPPKVPTSAGLVCNWDRSDREAAVQLQFHAGGGSALLEQRRHSVAGRGARRTPHRVSVPGAVEAFDVAAEGLLAMRVGADYIQISVVGGTAGVDDHLSLGPTPPTPWPDWSRTMTSEMTEGPGIPGPSSFSGGRI